MILTHASKEAIKYACLKFHYAKAVPVNTLGYNVYNDKKEWCGVILFGTGANNHIGDCYGLGQGEVLELVRVALNGKQETTSKAVAIALRLLKKDCPLCKLVVSYADIDQDHFGTIYQATNWIYVGNSLECKKDGSWVICGRRRHGKTISDWIKQRGGLCGLSRAEYITKYFDKNAVEYITKGKRKYLYPMNENIKKEIVKLSKPYQKKEDIV